TMRSRYEESLLRLADIDGQVKDLDVKAAQAAQTELEAQELITTEQNNLTQLSLQLSDLDNREVQLSKQDLEADSRDKNEITDLTQNIERLEQRLQRSRTIRTKDAGRILELTAPEGTLVTNGQRLAQIDTRKEDNELIALVYFTDAIGKQLTVGM